jgi:hypothetical protein
MYGLFVAYKFVRLLGRSHESEAFSNGYKVIRLERLLGLFTEPRLQHLGLHWRSVGRFLNFYYVSAHFGIMVAFLLGLFLFHPAAYRACRRVLITLTATALVIHLAFPLAPPRMFPEWGFIDAGHLLGPDPYGNASVFHGLANQFAAMPSLHFGWAALVAWGVITFTSTRWRWLILIHPVLTLSAIVLTGHHYWLDSVVAGGLLIAACRLDATSVRSVLSQPAFGPLLGPALVGSSGRAIPSEPALPSTERPLQPRTSRRHITADHQDDRPFPQ